MWSDVAQRLLTGLITFPPHTQLRDGAVAHVRLLDTSLADAPTTTVQQMIVSGIARLLSNGKPVAFALSILTIDPRVNYTVDIHVDDDGDGQISRGDYINMQSYPVLTFGHPDRVVVEVRQVT